MDPKPFALLSIETSTKKKEIIGHEKYRGDLFTGRLIGSIEALAPVTVASGVLELGDCIDAKKAKQHVLVRHMVKRCGVRYLPGSSLKGCYRSIVEAITNSGLAKVRSRVPARNFSIWAHGRVVQRRESFERFFQIICEMLPEPYPVFPKMNLTGSAKLAKQETVAAL